jgi:hypothetical protein
MVFANNCKDLSAPSDSRRESGNGTVSDKNIEQRPRPARDARDEAASMLNVSPSYVSDAERIKEKSPETFAEVKAGKTTIPEAKRRLAEPIMTLGGWSPQILRRVFHSLCPPKPWFPP